MAEESTAPDLAEFGGLIADAIKRRDLDTAMQFYSPHIVVDLTRTVGITVEGREAQRRFTED
jgi:ketosteroid isomerase-like protein